MLQIGSGKLFARDAIRRNELRGVIHSNLRLTGEIPVETMAGRLLPTNAIANTQTLVYEFTELIEDSPAYEGTISYGIDPYLRDFAAIVSFALSVTCTPDPGLTSRLTSGVPGPLLHVRPSELVGRVYDSQVWCGEEDSSQLVEIADGLMGLRRKSFLAAMRAIRTYVTGLHRIADDCEVAYTLLVASVESLTQGFDGHRAQWKDYDESKRNQIDIALSGADEETINKLRQAILGIEHVSLKRRFRSFTLCHLGPSYFREEATELEQPVGRAELQEALTQAYDLRSRYLHSLEELPSLLKLPFGHRETIKIDGTTFLTMQGIARLARHVITEFVKRQPKMVKEEYDYSKERFGIIYAPVAPKYWIWKPESVTNKAGKAILEGFLSQITDHFWTDPAEGVTDLREMLTKVETKLPGMNSDQRRPFLALYFAFNQSAPPHMQMKNIEVIKESYGSEIEKPSVEAVLMHLVGGSVPKWSLPEHQTVHDEYFRGAGKKNSLDVSPVLKAGLSLELAERYRAKLKWHVHLLSLLLRTVPVTHPCVNWSRTSMLRNQSDGLMYFRQLLSRLKSMMKMPDNFSSLALTNRPASASPPCR